ncbi:MAG: hypothetical protein J6X29_01695 [Clostridia bacterium]|nr:hypothetical protein [Clostridia bacterium]
MIKVWAKTYVNKKIVLNEIIYLEGRFNESLFDRYVQEICHTLDIPCPLIVSSNVKSFSNFNITRWKADDFVEHVPFDELTIENCVVPEVGGRFS